MPTAGDSGSAIAEINIRINALDPIAADRFTLFNSRERDTADKVTLRNEVQNDGR